MSQYKLTETEQMFMEYFWTSSEEKCKKDILSRFSEYGKSGNTISFYLSKLTKKKFLISRREGRNFFYKPTISKLEYEQRLLNAQLKRTYGNSLEMILACFCGKTDVTDKELQHIQNWLKKLEQHLNED